MRKRHKIAICLALSGVILANAKIERQIGQNNFNQVAFADSPSLIKGSRGGYATNTIILDHEFIKNIKSVEVNNKTWNEDSDNNRPNKRGVYYLSTLENGDEFSIVFTKLEKDDRIVIKSDKKILSFTISEPTDQWNDNLIDKNSIKEENIGAEKEDPQEKDTPPKNEEKKYILSSEGGFLNSTVRLDTDFVNSIKDVEVNGQTYKETSNSRPSKGQVYYLIKGMDGPNQDGIRFPMLNEGARVTIKNDKVALSFTIVNPTGSGEIIKKDSILVEPLSKAPSKKEDPSSGEDVSPKEVSFTYVSESFGYNILKLTSGEKLDKKKLEKITLNGKEQTKVDYPISISGNGNYAFSSDGELCIERLHDNDSLSVTYDGKEYKYIYKDKKLIENTDKKDVTYQIRLVGKFDSLLVGQTKLDGFSCGTASVSNNPNAVSVEYTDKENPSKDDWKKLEDRGNEFNEVKAVVVDKDTGIEANFAHGSIILGGSPTKTGTFKIKIIAEDKRGQKVESNEADVEVYNLGEKSLEELMVKDRFIQTQDKKYMWEMSPWKITKFNDSDNIVNVPKDLKAWFGSHESGTYGELGFETIDEPTQTLVVGQGANLTFKNMKILGSVKIIVKDGGILNLDDSVVFGKIEVSNGGKLNVNYSPYTKQITSGASIWGQVILKDGAILGTSSIYSNTNYAAQGEIVNTNDKPVIKVEGNAQIQGDVYIRGDEQATKGKSGQPALEVGPNGNLEITENSSLNLFGGGVYALTSVGGDALKLNGGTVTGKGKLVAIGGSGQGKKGGSGISGHGSISVGTAYIRGGNSSKNPAKAVESDKINFKGTKGITIDGKKTTNTDPIIPEDYWDGTKKISDDKVARINKAIEENKDKLIQAGKTENNKKEEKPAKDDKNKENPPRENKPEKKPSEDNKNKDLNKKNKDSGYLDKLYFSSQIPKTSLEKYKKLKEAYEKLSRTEDAAKLLMDKFPETIKPVRKDLEKLIEKSQKLRIIAEKRLKAMEKDLGL
uniref:hypothetical protein n=1 Tax=Anaerococcus mediterraneensis TaxID=1870984 RepID=UPI000931532E|nr:hypothetical protein [Anaerococcus mediterraneensis]